MGRLASVVPASEPVVAQTLAATSTSPTVTREPDGTLVIRLPPPPAPSAPDELLPFPFGNLERNAARALMKDGHLPVAKIGRKFYARRSDVLALVEKLAVGQTRRTPAKGESAAEAYRRLVRR